VIALAALALAAAVGIGALILHSPGGTADPLSAVPADAFMVVSIDMASLAESPIGEVLAGELRGESGARAGKILGVDSIAETCGFDPLPHLRAVALAIPEGDADKGEFGVAASGTLSKDVLASCAKAVITKRGGDPAMRQVGTFTVIADGRAPGGAEVAFRDGGLTIVGRGAWLARMIDAADGRAPSTLTAPGNAHASLRADLASRDTDAEAFRATALLPRALRERLEGELSAEPQAREGAQSNGSKMMEGVLGVSAAAIGLHAGKAHEDTRVVATARCDSESACSAVSTLILHTRLGMSGNLAYRMLGLGPLIDNLEVQPQGGASAPSLVAKTHAPVDDLAKILDRVLRPAAGSGSGGSSPSSRARSAPARPNEVIPAHPDAGR
jgi:hypothetical protein